jgi:antitoxin HigA-1
MTSIVWYSVSSAALQLTFDARITTEETIMLPSHRIATHPGQILLEEFLLPLGLTQAELARELTIPLNRVNELVRGKRGVTPETALLLAGYFKNSAEFWMNLQTAHDLTVARLDMRKRPRGITSGRHSGAVGAD